MQDLSQYLNPIFHDIDRILCKKTFKDPLFKQEFPHLQKTETVLITSVKNGVKAINDLIKQLEKQREIIEDSSGRDRDKAVADYNRIQQKIQTKINYVNYLLNQVDTPYFGKITFSPTNSSNTIQTYIGKSAVFDVNNTELLVSDWRSPIANLYYEHQGTAKDIFLTTPNAKIHGDITEKLQFIINRGQFKQIINQKSGNKSADEFLLYHLQNRTGKKLEDIVATIQKEQNQIIREGLDRNVIIQGVAGSGKTTILLHKIAYLLYHHKDKLNTENVLIIAPNKTFIEYIKDVLPNLGVFGIKQNTYLFWALKVLDWENSAFLSETSPNAEISKIKGSYKFVQAIKDNLEQLERYILDNIDDTQKSLITVKYYQYKKNNPQIKMLERLHLAVEFAFSQARSKYRDNFKYLSSLASRESKVKAYVNKFNNVYKIYKILLKNYQPNQNILAKSQWEQIKNFTLRYLSQAKTGQKIFMIDDIPIFIYLYSQLFNIADSQYPLMLVDEAQDLSISTIISLRSFTKNANLVLAGDLGQSIKQPRFFDSWDDVKKAITAEFPEDKISYHSLLRCYRTTYEIVEYIKQHVGADFKKKYYIPEAILRHGEPVTEIDIDTSQIKNASLKYFSAIEEILLNRLNSNTPINIAVLVDNDIRREKLIEYLKKNPQIKRAIVEKSEDNYQTGILITSVREAKGLEFNTVILENFFDHTDQLSQQLFYVGATRALHQLIVIQPS